MNDHFTCVFGLNATRIQNAQGVRAWRINDRRASPPTMRARGARNLLMRRPLTPPGWKRETLLPASVPVWSNRSISSPACPPWSISSVAQDTEAVQIAVKQLGIRIAPRQIRYTTEVRISRFAIVLVIPILVSGACTGSDDKSSTTGTTTTTTTIAPSPCLPGADEKPAKALLRCAKDSVAYVSNVAATGTGVVIAADGKRYVLTNLHVVDPYTTADITVAGSTISDVPIAGVSAAADIALVGPLNDESLVALPIGSGNEVEKGDDVFLVGYPGESGGTNKTKPDDLEATISSGIVSRLREAKEFGVSFIQTDATISGGQSGGPLFSDAGDLVGISGLSFAEFALALSGADVSKAVDLIVAGKGDPTDDRVPQRTDSPTKIEPQTSGTATAADSIDTQALYLPADSSKRTLKLTVEGADTLVTAVDIVTGQPIAVSKNATDLQKRLVGAIANAQGGDASNLPDPTAGGLSEKLTKPEVAPGTFEIPIEADQAVIITFDTPLSDTAVDQPWTAAPGLFPVSVTRPTSPIKVGETDDILFTTIVTTVDYTVELTAGQNIEVFARSAAGDLDYLFIDPSVTLNAVTLNLDEVEGIESVGDTDDGIYGTDARKSFDITTSGTYRIRVTSNGGVAELGRLSVTDCGKDPSSCKDDSPTTGDTTTTEAN